MVACIKKKILLCVCKICMFCVVSHYFDKMAGWQYRLWGNAYLASDRPKVQSSPLNTQKIRQL